MSKKLKILEICPFSAGICGVWTRVREESIRLAKKSYEIRIFSSNFTKGNDKIAESEDEIDGILIRRFPAKKLGGESYMNWDFEKEALDYCPDIIITHCYRHIHTMRALKLAAKLKKQGKKCKVFLVTHAPFERSATRTSLQNIIVWVYDTFIGKLTINQFDKIIAVSKWEIPYLLKIGANKNKIEYIPNGIPEEFFKLKKLAREKNKILFLGRISPIKNIEVAIRALSKVNNKRIILELVGPVENDYAKNLKRLIKELKLTDRIVFSSPVYDLKEKIKNINLQEKHLLYHLRVKDIGHFFL
ncbi:MAG: glycosyltransferase family 4 protein [Candidatus Pacearchaeota archaeon]